MPFTSEEFLEALNLPEYHPYVVDDYVSDPEEASPWSLVDYFVSAKNSLSINADTRHNECSVSSSCPWESQRPTFNTNSYSSKEINADKVSFFQEIKPCLASTFRMTVLLWAPIILFLCIKRLITPHRHAETRKLVCVGADDQFNKHAYSTVCDAAMMNRSTMSRGSQSSDANHTTMTDNKACFADFASLLSNFTPMFTIENNKQHSPTSIGQNCSQCTGTGDPLSYIIALLVSAITMMDAMYILEFSQAPLIIMHVLIIYIGIRRLGPKVALLVAMPITSLSFFKIMNQDLDLPTLNPGIYYSDANPIVSKAVTHYWPVKSRTYEGGTPWIMTGDTRTGLPFLMYSPPKVEYTRRWVPLPEEQEAVILDIAFPENNRIEDNANIYLVIHGINGHSNEGYVLDLANQLTAEGNIVAVMVTRGLMDSPVLGQNLLHFARTSDVGAAAKSLRNSLTTLESKYQPIDRPMLAGVGYSMGAITLANYVARAGKNCALDVAIGFSGALDTLEQVKFKRSENLWQPFICKAMRDTMVHKFKKQITSKFDHDQYNEMMSAKSLVDLDRSFFAPYNNFDGLNDYYSNTGPMGDFMSTGYQGRISNVSIPLLMVQSLDDPVGSWRTFHDPQRVAESGSGNTVLLFTEKGGHVGWPIGLNPKLHGWGWMNDLASSFVHAIRRACLDNKMSK